MYLESPGYLDGDTMTARFAAREAGGGMGLSVPLEWGGEPEGTRSFVLTMIDHHPIAHGWVHWLVTDIPRNAHVLAEGASRSTSMPVGAVEFANTGGRLGYGGPNPPAGSGVHDYVITLHALDIPQAGVDQNETWDDVHAAIQGHTLDSATLLGKFGT